MNILAEGSGYILHEHGPIVRLSNRELGEWTLPYWFALAWSGTAFVGFVVACAMLIAGESGALIAVAVCGGISAVIGPIALLIHRMLRRKNERPIAELPIVAEFDRARNEFRDGSGNVIAPLTATQLRVAFLFTSSGKGLRAVYPGGQRMIAKSDVFAGGFDDIFTALRRLGFMR